jgi:hypothetical protein
MKKPKFDPLVMLPARAMAYNHSEWGQRYPGSKLFVGAGSFVSGTWQLGRNYVGSGYYGSYPPRYIDRFVPMFADCTRVLHLFSGSLPRSKDYVTVDLQGNPSVKLDAHKLTKKFGLAKFHVIYADPPYTKIDAERYDLPMPNRRLVLEQCSQVLVPGGYLVWLDTVWPMVRSELFRLEGAILIMRSQNHRLRGSLLFRKPG